MNLVIDDAIEVKQATKTVEEKRRELGTKAMPDSTARTKANVLIRTDFAQGRQRFTHPGIAITAIVPLHKRAIRLRCQIWLARDTRHEHELPDKGYASEAFLLSNNQSVTNDQRV